MLQTFGAPLVEIVLRGIKKYIWRDFGRISGGFCKLQM